MKGERKYEGTLLQRVLTVSVGVVVFLLVMWVLTVLGLCWLAATA